MTLFPAECEKCGSKEHVSRDCPHGLLSSECDKCGSTEHATRDCPHGLLSNKCDKCGSTDHATRNCPHGLLSSECDKCGSKNHVTRDCPHGLLSSECDKCGSRDHATRDCPHGLFSTPRREEPRSIDREHSSGEGGLDVLGKLAGGVIVVALVFWFITAVAIPLVVINIASIALLGGVIEKKWSKVLFPVSIMGAIILVADYNNGWATRVLVSNVAFFHSWIEPLLYVNLFAGLTAAYLSIRHVLNSKTPPPVGAGEFSKRNLIAIGCLLVVGATTIGVQRYADARASHLGVVTQSQVQAVKPANNPSQITSEAQEVLRDAGGTPQQREDARSTPVHLPGVTPESMRKAAGAAEHPGGSQDTDIIAAQQDQAMLGSKPKPTAKNRDAEMLERAHKSLDELLKQ